jgi:hypothetical protein
MLYYEQTHIPGNKWRNVGIYESREVNGGISEYTNLTYVDLKHETNNERRFIVRFDVFSVVTMKNAVFWDIETKFLPHRKYITSPQPSQAC